MKIITELEEDIGWTDDHYTKIVTTVHSGEGVVFAKSKTPSASLMCTGIIDFVMTDHIRLIKDAVEKEQKRRADKREWVKKNATE